MEKIRKEIKDLVDQWIAATKSLNVDAIMSCYAPDVVAYDAISQFQFKGRDAYRKHWEACMEFMDASMVFEPHDLTVRSDGDLALAHFAMWCGQRDEKGEFQGSWMRGTVCCEKQGDAWKIVHEHYSCPFDPVSSQVITDAQP